LSIEGKAGRFMGIIAPFQVLPISPALHRTLDPPAGDKVNRVAKVLRGVLVGNLADVSLPILNNLGPLPPLKDLLLIHRNHSLIDRESFFIGGPFSKSTHLAVSIFLDVLDSLWKPLVVPGGPG
jgi:hypothetical protein